MPPAALLHKTEALLVLGFGADQCATDAVGVAVEEFGGRVHDDIRAESQWALQHRRHEGVVHADFDAARVGQLADSRDVAEDHQRIGGRLDVNQLRIGLDGRSHGVELVRVDILDLECRSGSTILSKRRSVPP